MYNSLKTFTDSNSNIVKEWKGVRLQKVAGELFRYSLSINNVNRNKTEDQKYLDNLKRGNMIFEAGCGGHIIVPKNTQEHLLAHPDVWEVLEETIGLLACISHK